MWGKGVYSGEPKVGGNGMCSGGLGAAGLGLGKGAGRDWLCVMDQVAATAAPPLVTAAVPRELRIDPCEKKSKETRLAA